MDHRVALVTGPQGLSGGAVFERLSSSPDWTVLGCSRRPDALPADQIVAVDLLDRAGTTAALAQREDITHLFFGAYAARAGDLAAEADANAAILVNTLDALRSAGAKLQHVVLYHGGKAYGAHLGPFRTPAKENAPRIGGPLLYHDQEDIVRERGQVDRFGWTVFRPDWVGGATTGSPINLVLGTAIYAVLCRDLGLPLRYPGSLAQGASLIQSTDARIIGAASEWACDAPEARDEIFNLTNGDAYRWQCMWGEVAAMFGLEVAEGGPSLTDFMAQHAERWAALTAEHGLLALDPLRVIDWPTIDFAFTCGFDMLTSTVKIRRAGFADCIDSRDMFADQLAELARRGVIPGDRLPGIAEPASSVGELA
ncbi:SDR family oxidoreductase [Aeromicrobium panaciterrae]|uniref:SDR family oxidoreductase n=1 Tax=Aeromicrobium panaciterrae TaxID=363861 RepID=UPI0031DFA369